jgi:hypothetical protein
MFTRTARTTLTCSLLLFLAACAKQENAEVQWARAALQRNPNFELIATDEHNGTFTLRDKQTGEVHAVSLNDIGAAPVSALVATQLPAPAPTPSVPTQESSPAPNQEPAMAAHEPQREPVVQEEPVPPASQTAATTTPSGESSKPYTIERTGGQLKISGPGISVVSAGKGTNAAQEAQSPQSGDPIICEGPRMLHFDGRNINVNGDAITVRGGCELYITNSNIVASGTGVVVHDGTVHITNSYIEGASGSFEADSQAKVFVRGSTFQGLSRRDQLATIQDQGGNRWR